MDVDRRSAGLLGVSIAFDLLLGLGDLLVFLSVMNVKKARDCPDLAD
jgi:hypothetical protein